MKIRILSDLHCTFQDFSEEFKEKKADLTVIAGDVRNFTGTFYFLDSLIQTYPKEKFVFVPGNHDFYGPGPSSFEKMLESYEALCKGTNVEFLYNKVYEVRGLQFFGGTMWSDFSSLYGLETRRILKDWYAFGINDVSCIPGWSSEVMLEENEKFMKSLREFLDVETTKKKIVVSHFAPNTGSIAEKFKSEVPWNSYWVNDVPEAWEPNLWIHGHCHTSFDYPLGLSRIICNPRGYRMKNENTMYNPNLIIDAYAL